MPFQVLFLYHFCFLLNFYDFLWWCNCLLLYLPLLTFLNFFSASAFWKREWAFCILQKRLDIIGLCNFYILFFKDAIDFVLSFTRCILRNSIFFCLRVCVCVCVCVCVYVCVFVFIFLHREDFFRLQNVQDILEGTDQRSCVVNISCVPYAKFHHLCIWKYHISPPKTKLQLTATGEKR